MCWETSHYSNSNDDNTTGSWNRIQGAQVVSIAKESKYQLKGEGKEKRRNSEWTIRLESSLDIPDITIEHS